jgi:hypothetical protein
MKILVACEESQTVCKAFREKGHEVYSCDIQECSGGHPEWHIQGDVLPLLHPKWYELNRDGEGNQWEGYKFKTADGKTHQLEGKWDLIIAHPPCQFLTNTGNPYLNVERWGEKAIQRANDREKAFEFFMRFVNADCEKICIENPIGYPNTHYRKPNQIIQPWQFGHPFTKATCLWLKGLEPLKPFVAEKPKNCKSYAYETMIDERGKTISWNSELSRKLRSKTFEGIAEAMAEQWGNHPTEKGGD